MHYLQRNKKKGIEYYFNKHIKTSVLSKNVILLGMIINLNIYSDIFTCRVGFANCECNRD